MKFKFISIAFLIFVFISFINKTEAATYPIAELGNCRDARECYLYCEIPANKAACWSYGKYILNPNVLAEQDSSGITNLSFPIIELGNCANANECRGYCNNPEHKEACVEYAVNHNLGKYKQHYEMLQKAREELSCTTFIECRDYCKNQEHVGACMRFAAKFAPEKVKERFTQVETMIERAKEALNCTDVTSCRRVCSIESNKTLCKKFAEENLPETIKQKREEILNRIKEVLPCDSVDSCRTFCEREENRDKCRFSTEDSAKLRLNIINDRNATCDNEDDCEEWCKVNPSKCPGFREAMLRVQKNKEELEKKAMEEKTRLNNELRSRLDTRNTEVEEDLEEETTVETEEASTSNNP